MSDLSTHRSRPRSRRGRLTMTTVAAAVVLVAAAVFGAGPAGAAPGDAAAVGLAAELDVTIGDVSADISGSIGAVSAPPSETSELLGADAQLGDPALAALSADAVSTGATSTPGVGSSAFAEVTDAQLDLPVLTPLVGGILVDTDGSVIRAEADCPVGATPRASVGDDLTVLVAGTEVVVDADGMATVELTGDGGAVIGTVTLVLDETTTTSDTAAAVAVQLDVSVDLVDVASIEGSATIAQASCETPAAIAPTAATIDPQQGPTTGGTDVTITGTAFVPGATTVTIGGNTVPADQVDVAGDGTSLDFSTPPHAEGLVDVTVATPGGTTDPLAFTYVPPAPTATTIDPAQGPTTGGTEVTITGTDFVPGSTSVTIGGTTVPAGEVAVTGDGTSLDFSTPPHAEGPVDVTVTTPDGTTGPLDFTYVAPDSPPTVTDLDPDQGPTSGGTTVVVDGTGFVPGATTVTIGGTTISADDVAVSGDGTSLTFSTPPHDAGGVDVTVTTPDGSAGPLDFTYVAADSPPTATDVDPDQGPTTGGTTVVVIGTGFVPGETTVTIGGVEVPADEVAVAEDGTSLSFTAPPHGAGVVDLTVTTPDGTTAPLRYTYVASGDGGPSGPSADQPGDGAFDDGFVVARTGSGSDSGSGHGGPGHGGPLPQTGTDVGGLLLLALGALGGGAVLLGIRRRFLGSHPSAG